MRLQKYLNEAKKITVKDLPSMYHKDPLYKAVLMAKSKSEYDKALKTLKSIRGETAFRNFVAAIKDANEVMDKARKKYESTLSEAVKLSKKEKKWFDKQTSGGRLFVPVHTGGDFEHKTTQKLLKANVIKFAYDSGSHEVFDIIDKNFLEVYGYKKG
jgi:glycyl-tRNA synthetase beta subunit